MTNYYNKIEKAAIKKLPEVLDMIFEEESWGVEDIRLAKGNRISTICMGEIMIDLANFRWECLQQGHSVIDLYSHHAGISYLESAMKIDRFLSKQGTAYKKQ